jgi:hypothetical protein
MRPLRTHTIRPSRRHSAKSRVVPAFRSAAVTLVLAAAGAIPLIATTPQRPRIRSHRRRDRPRVRFCGRRDQSHHQPRRQQPARSLYRSCTSAPRRRACLRSRLSCGWHSTGQNASPGSSRGIDGTAEHRFSGSIDLMSAIDALIAGADKDPDQRDPERNST